MAWGVTAAAGAIGGGAAFNGSGQIICGSNVAGFQFSSSQSFTDSAWFYLTNGSSGWGNIISNSRDVSPWHGLWVNSGTLYFDEPSNQLSSSGFSMNSWHYAVAVQTAGVGTSLYIDGVLVASDTTVGDGNGGGTCEIGNDSAGDAFPGSIDEVRIASVARSADWIATEYANQSSPSTFYAVSSESGVGIAPPSVGLYASQTQQFAAPSECSSMTWSISPSGVGTINTSGLYTAPSTIGSQQTVTVTATSTSGPSDTLTATVTLMPSSTEVTVSPTSAILYASQTQQFTANTNVTWSISPAGTGSISSSGLYTAPSAVATQQTVTVTATSQADPTKSALATITLTPTLCTGNGYSYVRTIVIDHTKVPNTDQANFPFLFNTTDPMLKTTANGGHVTNASGYDIIFTSDPAGQNRLSYEMEEYNPATGQVIAWVNIPNLSHASDTVIYLFYGNQSVTSSQQNPSRVWDTNYVGVWHLPNGTSLSANDSTTNGNNGTPGSGVGPVPGLIDGAASFNGASTANIPVPSSSNVWNLANDVTVSAWIKTSSNGVGIIQLQNNNPLVYLGVGPTTVGGASNKIVAYLRTNSGSVLVANGSATVNDNNWHNVQVVRSTGNSVSIYVDGMLDATTPYSDSGPINISGGAVNIGFGGTYAFSGIVDEVRISKNARSADWIVTEYNNESSPSTFFALGSENQTSVAPGTVTLYASQFQQFLISGLCNSGEAVWSMPAGSPGTLTSGGLYTAPENIQAQQIVTITGTTLGASSVPLTAAVTLMPPVSVSVTPPSGVLYGGQSQQVTATVSNTSNSAVRWTVAPSGVGSVGASGLYTAPSSISAQQTVQVIATSDADSSQSAAATITLLPPPSQPPIGVSISPLGTTLYGGQSQQFTANVINTSNTAVTWSVSPSGAGTISTNGLYTAPNSITAQQELTITATSQANTSVSASATIELAPTVCASNGYSYVRQIVINASQVPNTDQANFPFLFNTTDPMLKTTANGGHVTNPSGDDIIFSTDPNGLTKLNHEIEEYNPLTGTLIAWVSIPTLSHSANTVLYLFYGNSSITTPQQNPAAVWDSNYGGVWHLEENGTTLSTADSTANANNGTVSGAASSTLGEIGYGAALSGDPNHINAGNASSVSPTHTGTMSIWANYNGFAEWVTPMGNGDLNTDRNGAMLWNENNGMILFEVDGPNASSTAGGPHLQSGQWYYLVGTWDGSTVRLYVNGSLVGTTTQQSDASPAYDLNLGADGALSYTQVFMNGVLDEARVSNIARSADWIATEYNNQSSPANFYTLLPEITEGVSPNSATLYASQSQQFSAVGICSPGVTWSMSAGALGTLTANGLYTAPTAIAEQQTVTVTATNQGNTNETISATVTLMPPILVSVIPVAVTLNADQTQQFGANVANTSNQAVTWTISPAGIGTIDADGVYTAPSTITSQQTVTITATSQADSSQSASATVTLNPSQCASSGYGYQRVIVIDHTKVPNTDQADFPFLFNTIDPDLAFAGNGGHVANPNGYDIFFSTDPNGATKLNHEVETYNPTTGQLIAWVRIPNLSHTTDTVVYLFYGNPNVTASEQNPKGVWKNDYQAVYHLANVSGTNASDSTNFGNNASLTAISPASGGIDGAAGFNGSSSYLQIPGADFPNYPTGTYVGAGLPSNALPTFTASFGAWFKTTSPGGILQQVPSLICFYFLGECVSQSSTEPGANQPAGWDAMLYVDDTGHLAGDGFTSPAVYDDNNWHFAVVTYAVDGTNTLYVDGQNVASGQDGLGGYSSAYNYFVGTAYTLEAYEGNWNWLYFNGAIEEVSVTNDVLSADWIQTEYNNQSSPSTFYRLYPRNTVQVAPAAVNLYALETQQFTVPGSCDAAVTFSIPSGAPGAITLGGLYTAPETVSSAQTVTVTASNPPSGQSVGTATVTLLPPPAPLTLVASAQSPYTTGTSQSFTATVLNPDGTPVVGATVSFLISGANSASGNETTNASGVATYSYAGTNNGTDSIQATSGINGELLTSNTITASWVNPTSPTPSAAVTLVGPPTLGAAGLVGAFTDSTGKVIEPISIGAASSEFIVPTGATQLQLGVDSAYYPADGGPGYVVSVNGNPVTVPPTAMPWTWATGGLNTAYQYGVLDASVQNGVLDGTNPIIGATRLAAGQVVTVALQSGSATANQALRPVVNANGDQGWITGVNEWQGTYFSTFYTSTSAYPVGQPIPFNALVTNSAGAPAANVPVTLTVSGANPGQYTATTDSTGTATFLYTGTYAGTDSLVAQANPTGGPDLTSTLSSVAWVNSGYSSSTGSLSLQLFATNGDGQGYAVTLTDSSGNPLTNVNVGFYVWGVDNFSEGSTTDETGHAFFTYNHSKPGTYNVVAVTTVNGNVIFSSPILNATWTPPTTTNTCSNCNNVTVSIEAQTTVAMPNPLQLNGTVMDGIGATPTISWTQVSGPGLVTFANPQQAVTTATFSQIGTYVLQLYASDSGNNATAQFQVSVVPPAVAASSQGWVGSPLYGAAVSGVVPITLAPGVSLASGTLSYMPTNNPNSVTVLNSNVTGSGQIGSLDTTALANGSYWIQLQGTNANGSSQYSLVMVTVTGDYKPGRVTSTVTDLAVPSTGMAISIQRTYDSLNASASSDFGYGWSLGVNVNLSVDPSGNVTFTIGGQRKTFYLTPQVPPCTLAGCLFADYFVAYTPEPGLHGTLVDSGQACPLDIVVPDGSLWECADGDLYNPQEYIYTDANGTQYNISMTGGLQSITDRSGNGLTITANGITSTTGLNVPFVRDDQNRITQITDPQGNIYQYSYDENGNLASVTYPNTSQPSTYTYDSNHYYLSGTDFRSNPLPSTQYYAAGETDAAGNSVTGKLQSVTDAAGETTTYTYNLSTNTTTVTYPPDAGGNVGTATMVYDSLGDLVTSTDPLGHITRNVYDANRNLLSTTDPLSHSTSYTYDSNGNKTSQTYPATATSTNTTSNTTYNQYSEPTSTTDELGNVRTFTYDGYYNPRSVTDGLGTLMSSIFNTNGTLQSGAIGYDITQTPTRGSQFSYDDNGNLIGKTDALGRTTSYTYNSLGQKVSMTPPLPNSSTSTAAATTTYEYDAFGNLTQTSAPLGRATSSTYDGNGNKISDVDARSQTTHYTYDALNRLTLTSYPNGFTSSKTYDFRNNVIDETDQEGHVTHHVYDLAGRESSVTQAYGTSDATSTSYTYYDDGRKHTETDDLGHTTTYTYDAAGNLTGISGVKGSFTYTYDNARNQVSMADGDGNTTYYQYDARKRLTVTTYPDTTTKTNGYDGPGNLISVTDQANNQVQYHYDAANQLSSVVQVNSPNTNADTTVYGYDSNGNPITLVDANSHQTIQNFDLLSEMTGKSLPDGTLTESRTYDNNGNLQMVTHFDGTTTTYSYDQLNRLLSRATPGETTVSFTYTHTGKYLTSTDQSGTTNYTYDSMDRLTAKATPEGTLNYTYDAAGHVASISSSNTNGASMSYAYDDLNRLSTVTDNNLSGSNTTTYTYDGASNVATVTYPNGVQTTFNYDQFNRVSATATQSSGYLYHRGQTGNLTSATELSGRTVNWSYDGIYRLTNETISLDPSHNNGSVSYGLDPVGNRTSESSSLSGIPSGNFGFNADDELSNERYDQNGNVTMTAGKSFTYDSQNQLISMSESGTSASIIYDAFGNRVSKTVNGATTKYLVDDLNPTGYPQVFDELNGSGTVTRSYTYGLQRIDENQLVSNVWTPSFYEYDGGGNVRQLTNTAGTVTDSYEYDAYGNSFTVSGTTPNEMMYRGEQYDSDLGLYYLRARYYNPATGRFMSRDPLDGTPKYPQSLHKYLYTGGDPINWIDPLGREDEEEYSLLQKAAATVALIGIEAVFTLETAELWGMLDGPPGGYPPHPAPGTCPTCGEPGLPPTGPPYPPGQMPPITPDPGTWPEAW